MARAGIALGAAAIAVGAMAPTSAATVPRRAPDIVTQAQTGRTFRLAPGRELTLRLSGRWSWTEPRVRGRGAELTPVEYFVDPGYREWRLAVRDRGVVTVSSTGTPACDGCGRRRFHVTFAVG